MNILPNQWTSIELQRDVTLAKSNFRHERLNEPLDLYNKFYGEFSVVFADLVNKLETVFAEPVDPKVIAKLLKGKRQQKAFRYLTSPPISEDDLKSVADTSIAPTVISADPEKAKVIKEIILEILDPHRFPWIKNGTKPTDDQIASAVMASAAMAGAREVESFRRSTSKDAQELAVKEALKSIHMKEVAARDIKMLTAAPDPGEFCGESRIAGSRADVVARLLDGRVMAIECKVSNSSVNSYKRVVHDTGGKAAHWYQQLGRAQVIPCAVLSGVFNPANLEMIQTNGPLFLFWEHRLDDLCKFIMTIK